MSNELFELAKSLVRADQLRLNTIRELDNRPLKDYNLQLILERDALRNHVKELREFVIEVSMEPCECDCDPQYPCHSCEARTLVQRLRQALKETVRHE